MEFSSVVLKLLHTQQWISKVHEQNLDPNLEENGYLKSKILALEA